MVCILTLGAVYRRLVACCRPVNDCCCRFLLNWSSPLCYIWQNGWMIDWRSHCNSSLGLTEKAVFSVKNEWLGYLRTVCGDSNVRILSFLQKCLLGNKMISAVTLLVLSGLQLLHCQGDHASLNQVMLNIAQESRRRVKNINTKLLSRHLTFWLQGNCTGTSWPLGPPGNNK